jgi:hypothetical protein
VGHPALFITLHDRALPSSGGLGTHLRKDAAALRRLPSAPLWMHGDALGDGGIP